MLSDAEEDALLSAALSSGPRARVVYADWLDARGRSAEAKVWRLPVTDVAWFKTAVGHVSSFYSAFFSEETYKINWERPYFSWMQPVKYVLFEVEGNQQAHLPWISLVYYDDGEPQPFLLVICLEDCQDSGWFGQAIRFDTLVEALEELTPEQRERVGLDV
jgi:uncharacterized protein (TIGR02996 family)